MSERSEQMEITSTALLAFVVRVYNQGYKAGHHDTVEGGYVDIFDCDMTTYHEDVVREIITEANKEMNSE